MKTGQSIRKYGWKRDLPDQRDFQLTLIKTKLPQVVDLRIGMPPVYDQGQLGSCTANAIAAALQFEQMKQKEVGEFIPSRLFIYYNERAMEGTIKSDAGASIRDGIKTVNVQGACKETPTWPYIISKFKTKPPATAYAEAIKYESLQYYSVLQTLNDFQTRLANGYPIIIGISVYSSFESDVVSKTGIVPMPAKNESLLGGHAILVCGYDSTKQVFIVRNSWGTSWGMQGYFTLPFAYVMSSKLASDFWTITLVK